MFIRRTTIKSRESGEPYYSYRLVESVRTLSGVRQHTLLNLGRHFEVPRPQWGPLAGRIEALVQGQLDLLADGLDAQWEAIAEQIAARLVSRRGAVVEHKDGEAAQEAITSGWTWRGWRSSARAVSGPSMWHWRRCGNWVWSASSQSWGLIGTNWQRPLG
jgi:hypothetical protein